MVSHEKKVALVQAGNCNALQRNCVVGIKGKHGICPDLLAVGLHGCEVLENRVIELDRVIFRIEVRNGALTEIGRSKYEGVWAIAADQNVIRSADEYRGNIAGNEGLITKRPVKDLRTTRRRLDGCCGPALGDDVISQSEQLVGAIDLDDVVVRTEIVRAGVVALVGGAAVHASSVAEIGAVRGSGVGVIVVIVVHHAGIGRILVYAVAVTHTGDGIRPGAAELVGSEGVGAPEAVPTGIVVHKAVVPVAGRGLHGMEVVDLHGGLLGDDVISLSEQLNGAVDVDGVEVGAEIVRAGVIGLVGGAAAHASLVAVTGVVRGSDVGVVVIIVVDLTRVGRVLVQAVGGNDVGDGVCPGAAELVGSGCVGAPEAVPAGIVVHKAVVEVAGLGLHGIEVVGLHPGRRCRIPAEDIHHLKIGAGEDTRVAR